MGTHEQIKFAIMARVKRIAFMRRVYHSPLTKVLVLAIFGISETVYISLNHVFSNIQHLANFRAFLHYSKVAFINTELGAKALIVASMIFALLLVKDIILSIVRGKIPLPSFQTN